VAVFRPTSSRVSVHKVLLCPFHCKPTPSGVSLEYAEVENIPPVPRNRAQVGKNHDARKAVPASLSVLKWSCAIFRPRGSKVRIRKVLLCPFYCKPRQSGVSLKLPGLENIPQVPGNRGVVCQNHDSHQAVSATLSVLKWSVAIFWPRSSHKSVEKVFRCPFHCKARPSGVSLQSPGLENIPQVSENRA